MKKMLISMREDEEKKTSYIENNYVEFFSKRGFLVIPVPNKGDSDYINELIKRADCIVLSGGNDLVDRGPRMRIEKTIPLKIMR